MSPAEQQDPRVGRTLLDRYRVLERLSSGGMGVVYRGERVQLGRVVAIKFLHSSFAHSDDFRVRFEREGRTMSKLDHPNCVSVIDFGVDDTPFFVMDYVSGVTLRDLLDQGALPPRRALALTRQILAGLAHAHERGVIHRDVKPANIMVASATGTGDQVRILDFGLAKLIGVDSTSASIVVGTPSYMSPEQASGKPVDGRSDIYGTSVLLFEMLTGDKPFVAEQAVHVIKMHLEKTPPTLAEAVPGARFSPELEAAVRKGLAKSPAERFQTPGELAEALAATPEARGETGPPARRAPPPRPPSSIPELSARVVEDSHDVSRDPTVASPVAPAPRPRAPAPSGSGGVWLALLLLAGLGGGGYWFWNQIGRPGLPKLGAPAKQAAPVTLAEADRLAAAGDRDGAISLLHDLRKRKPGDTAISLRLGALYHDKGWHSEAVAAYREALERDRKLATNAQLQDHVIAALGHAVAADKAEQLIVKRIGAAATARLRAATKPPAPPALRQRAARVLERLK